MALTPAIGAEGIVLIFCARILHTRIIDQKRLTAGKIDKTGICRENQAR